MGSTAHWCSQLCLGVFYTRNSEQTLQTTSFVLLVALRHLLFLSSGRLCRQESRGGENTQGVLENPSYLVPPPAAPTGPPLPLLQPLVPHCHCCRSTHSLSHPTATVPSFLQSLPHPSLCLFISVFCCLSPPQDHFKLLWRGLGLYLAKFLSIHPDSNLCQASGHFWVYLSWAVCP